MKRLAWWLIGIAAIVGICVGLHEITSYSARTQQSATITVGSMGSDYEVWQHIA
ncbi:metal ABC transporter substrate-binding protein, partial [Lactiplantibacillus plantarum]